MKDILCPFTSAQCTGEKCLVWGNFLTINPDGRATNKPAGSGCTFFNKIIREAKHEAKAES
jgi:hypothetical protein